MVLQSISFRNSDVNTSEEKELHRVSISIFFIIHQSMLYELLSNLIGSLLLYYDFILHRFTFYGAFKLLILHGFTFYGGFD